MAAASSSKVAARSQRAVLRSPEQTLIGDKNQVCRETAFPSNKRHRGGPQAPRRAQEVAGRRLLPVGAVPLRRTPDTNAAPWGGATLLPRIPRIACGTDQGIEPAQSSDQFVHLFCLRGSALQRVAESTQLPRRGYLPPTPQIHAQNRGSQK